MSIATRSIGHPGYSETLARVSESAMVARSLVRVATAAWDLKNLSESCAVVVTELVANAVQHAQGNDIRVVVERVKPRTVCVSVSDSSPVSPVLRSPSESVEGGRGLILVSALAKDWGTKQLPGGKEVWATVQ